MTPYNAHGQGERILKDALATAQAYNDNLTKTKRIDVVQVSTEYRAMWLWGEIYWQPQRVTYNWPGILQA